MKKIVVFVLTICCLGGVVEAQTLESKYGLDSAETRVNASIYAEFYKSIYLFHHLNNE